ELTTDDQGPDPVHDHVGLGLDRRRAIVALDVRHGLSRHGVCGSDKKSSTTGTATSGRRIGRVRVRVPAGWPPTPVFWARTVGSMTRKPISEASLSSCAYSTFPARSGRWRCSSGQLKMWTYSRLSRWVYRTSVGGVNGLAVAP